MIAGIANGLLRSGPAAPALVVCSGLGLVEGLTLGPLGGRIVDSDDLAPDSDMSEQFEPAIFVLARTLTDLRRTTTLSRLLPKTRRVVLVVAETSPNHLPPVPSANARFWKGLNNCEIRRHPEHAWSVDLQFIGGVKAEDVLGPVSRAIGGDQFGSRGPVVGIAGPGSADWRPADPGAPLLQESGPPVEEPKLHPFDLAFRSAADLDWTDERIAVIERTSDPHAFPPIDELMINPTGFIKRVTAGNAILAYEGDAWVVRMVEDGEERMRLPAHTRLSEAEIARVRWARSVHIEWGNPPDHAQAAGIIAGLAAAGIPLTAGAAPGWARLLGEDLVRLLGDAVPDDMIDRRRREAQSLRLRRLALRTHSTRARWRALAAAAGVPAAPWPTVSVLLCTRRPDMVAAGLEQVNRQRLVDTEVVLSLHGVPADHPSVGAAVQNYDKALTVLEVPPDVPFGTVLNRAAARATGAYLAKMDDDDWYGPEHLADLLLALDYSGADLVGCPMEYVYAEAINRTLRLRAECETFTHHVAGSSFLLSHPTLLDIGGFRPVHRSVDSSCMRSVLAAGGRIYMTHGLGYLVRRSPSGHTWTEPLGRFLRRADEQWSGFRPTALMEMEAQARPRTALKV